MAKSKQGRDKRTRRDARRRKRQRTRQSQSDVRRGRGFALTPVPLDPTDLDRCATPIHVQLGAGRVPDPYELLGLDASAPPTPDEIRAAWQKAIARHPPERDPEAVRAITAARDRLLDPERYLDRRMGVLHPPDPVAHGLPVEPISTRDPHRLPARTRLIGQLMLYALLEDELSDGRTGSGPQRELPF